MIQTIDDFIKRFNEIKAMGWVTTHRSGPTGIGKTLEDLLGIPENNIDGPDFGIYELKSCRLNSSSMLTLFTKTPLPANSNTYLRKKYGYISDEYEYESKVLHSTLNAVRFVPIYNTGNSLKIGYDNSKLFIESQNGPEDVYWDREGLKKAFEKKYKGSFVYAKADSMGSGSSERFKFTQAFVVSGFSYESFIQLLQEGKLFVDIRIGQYPDGRTHDHGTGFRIREVDQHLLFKNVKQIC